METQVKNSSQTLEPPVVSSTCSSPSHDFSFTISKLPTKTASSCPFAVDLSPADDIFFHGHLLPLHLLSHLPVSPRTSTGSFNDGFTLPVNDILPEHGHPTCISNNTKTATEARNTSEVENRVKAKPVKSFSLFSLPKWRKGLEGNEQKKKLLSLDLSHAVKKYVKMLFQRRENGKQFRSTRQPPSSYSFSSSLMGSKGNTKTIRGRRGDLFSAPASMRTSPTNSGHLRVSTAGLSSSSASTSSSSSDSTMEELQAAIQAAIAHCKNSSSSLDR